MSPHTNDPFRASDELRNLRETVQEIVPQPGDIPELAGIDIYGATIPLNGVGGSDHVIYVDFKKRYDLDARIRRAIERDQPSIVDNLERCRKMAGVAVDDIWVFRLAPDQARVRQRQRLCRHQAHQIERQPAQPVVDGGSRGSDGP